MASSLSSNSDVIPFNVTASMLAQLPFPPTPPGHESSHETKLPASYGLLRYLDHDYSKKRKPAPILHQCKLRVNDGKWDVFTLCDSSFRQAFMRIPPEVRAIILGYMFTVRYYVPVSTHGIPVISGVTDPALVNMLELLKDVEFGAEAAEALYRNNTFCVQSQNLGKFLAYKPVPTQAEHTMDIKAWISSLKIVIPCWNFHKVLVDGINNDSSAFEHLFGAMRSVVALPRLKKVEIILCLKMSCHWSQELTVKLNLILFSVIQLRKAGKLSRVTLRHYEQHCCPEADLMLSQLDLFSDEDWDLDSDLSDEVSDEDSGDGLSVSCSLSEYLDLDGVDIDTCSITSDVDRARNRRGITFPSHDDDKFNAYLLVQEVSLPIALSNCGPESLEEARADLRPSRDKWIYSDADISYWFGKQKKSLRERFMKTEHPVAILWHHGYHEIEQMLATKDFPKKRLTGNTLVKLMREFDET